MNRMNPRYRTWIADVWSWDDVNEALRREPSSCGDFCISAQSVMPPQQSSAIACFRRDSAGYVPCFHIPASDGSALEVEKCGDYYRVRLVGRVDADPPSFLRVWADLRNEIPVSAILAGIAAIFVMFFVGTVGSAQNVASVSNGRFFPSASAGDSAVAGAALPPGGAPAAR